MIEIINKGMKWLLVLGFVIFIVSCDKVENFRDIEGLRFQGNYASESIGGIPEEIRAVTFNIEFAIKIDKAIQELRESENMKNADIIFLQEMDEVGTEAIAASLAYNYVYYPSNRNPNGQLFGLAILSKWPIVDDEKILLPHTTPINDRKRIAVTANIMVGDQEIRVYNMHPATLSVPKAHRREQFRTIIYHLNDLEEVQQINRVIIAGDFNTDKSNDIDYLVDTYKAEGFIWVSEEIGPTWQTFSGLAKFTLDHVFSRGFDLIDAGKPSKTKASDHLPVWVRLKW